MSKKNITVQDQDLSSNSEENSEFVAALKLEIESLKFSVSELKEKNKKITDEVFSYFSDKYTEQYDQLSAEFERKKALEKDELQKEKQFCLKNFALDVIEIYDSLFLIIDGNQNISPSLEKNLNSLLTRMGIILQKNSIQQIVTKVGDPFDRDLHSIIMLEENSNQPTNTIVRVIKSGYKMHDMIIRHALVIAAK